MPEDEKEDFLNVLSEFNLIEEDFTVTENDLTNYVPNGVFPIRGKVEITHVPTSISMKYDATKWITDFLDELRSGLYRKFLP